MGAGTEGAGRCFRGSGGTNREGKRCDVWTGNLFPQSVPRFIPIPVQRDLLWSGAATLKAKRGKASMRYPVLAILLIAAACTPNVPPPAAPTPEPAPVKKESSAITSSSTLVRQMHDRYSGKWYKTLSFEQTNTYTSGGKEQKSQWVQR